MELKASSKKPGGLSSVDCISDPEDKEISDNDDDDRNHKHRRRDTQAQSPVRDQLEQGLNRPYRIYNKHFQNGNMFREGAQHSHYNSDPKFDKRRQMTNYSQAFSDMDMRFKLNQSIPVEPGHTRGRGRDISWYQRDSRFSSMDVSPLMGEPGPIPSAMFVGTGLPNVSNPQSSSWNSIGFIPGIPNGAIDAMYPLGWQGPLRPTLNPSMNIGIPRQRCRDFEERGFCLRGDMCPMEHGVNRIVVEDVQSLSQFNLPVSMPSAPPLGTSVGAGLVPPVPAASSSLINRKSSHRINKHQKDEDMLYLDGVPGPADASGTDVYDPDQPLWNNDLPDPSNLLLAMHHPRINDSESLMDAAPSERFLQNSSVVTGSQNSVWGRIGTSKSKLDVKEKVDSGINSSSLPVSKIQETQVEVRSAKGTILSGRQINSEPVQRAGDSSSKAQDDIGHYVRKPSQKAQQTLFVNFIPLRENKREALLAHFRKFGQVIDIYIPPNTERAFIQFSKREEAEAALKAPDAVMGNRFIKMWWANRDSIPDKSISIGSTSTLLTRDVSVPPHSTISKGKNILSVSIPKVSATQAVDSPVTPINDSKAVGANGSKSSPALQKKLQSLELLEEIRRKQEQLDQKRNEFRLKLNKLEKQATGIKVHAEHASKRLRAGITAPTVKSENSRFTEPVGSGDAFIAHESVLKPQTGEKILSSSGQMDLALSALPDSSDSKEANCALPIMEIEGSGTNNQLDIGLTTFTVNPPLPSGLADVDALRAHFSSFGELSNVELEYLKAEDAENSSCDPESVDNCSALVSFRSHHAADIAFGDGKNWHGHNLHFAWVHVGRESSPNSKEHRHGLVQLASGIPKDVAFGREGKTSDIVPSIPKRRGPSPSLKDSSQSAEKSAVSVVLEEDASWKPNAEVSEDNESYIELATVDDSSEQSPAQSPDGRQQPPEGEVC